MHREEEHPPLSVYGTLSTLCWAVAEHRGVSGPGDRDNEFTLLQFIGRHVDYVTRHAELAVEVDAQLRDLVSALRPLTGDRRRRVGKCPRPHPDPPEDAEDDLRCGAVLYAPREADEIQDMISCGHCGHSWAMDEWLCLGDEIELAPDATR